MHDSQDTNVRSQSVRQGSLVSGLRVVGMFTLFSRLLGLVRDMGMAGLFGLSPVLDAFTLAFRVPNLTRRLFGEGALAASFVPVLARELSQQSRPTVWKLASAVVALLTLVLTGLVLFAELGLAAASIWVTTPENNVLLGLTAVLLPYLVLICVASQISAVLNALGHFSVPAIVPIVLNFIWLIAIWLIAPQFADAETQAYVVAFSILLAGVLQVGIQWFPLRQYGFEFQRGWRDVRPQVREIVQSMLPVMLGLSITQLNTFADGLIAWGFSAPFGETTSWNAWQPIQAGAVSALYFGERMYQFPLGIFGVALGTVMFPLLARHAAEGEFQLLRDDLTLGLRLVIAIGVPASAGLAVLSLPIAECLFQHGEFHAADALRTARVIATYGSGVWAYCGVLILQRGCYALGDRISPLNLAVMAVFLNFVLNLLLIWPFGELGLAASTAACAMLQFVGLIWLVQQRVGALEWRAVTRTLLKTLAVTACMTIAGAVTVAWGQHQPQMGRLLKLAIPLSAAGLTFLPAAALFRLEEFWMLIRRGKPKPTK